MWFSKKGALERTRTVEAEIRYLRDHLSRPRIDAFEPAKTVVSLSGYRVPFHDGRVATPLPSLDREGFACVPHRSGVSDFSDAGNHASYVAELDQLIRNMTGASLVFVSPMLVIRSRDHPQYGEGVIADAVAGAVHGDRTDRSVWSEVRRALLHYGVETIPEGRLVAYNLWRVLTPPPQDFPLALCDLRSIRADDLVRADSVGNPANGGEIVEFYLSVFNPEHRWSYFPDLTRDELLVFQQFDTAARGPSGCLHTAFQDPSCVAAAATRQSVEARAYVFFPS